MPLHFINNTLWFPPVVEATKDGLLAAGGDLSTERLLLAYRSGIFPWFNEDEIPLWWSPDPRFVLYPDELRISKSMKQIIKSGVYEFRIDTALEEVINNCKNIHRPGQSGTWITPEVATAYILLHKSGYAHSAETWQDGELVGGLYGVLLGKTFFGESMFSHKTNASKFAFINWVQELKSKSITLIDCQVYTKHLESLGARMIPRKDFITQINIL